MAITNVVKVRRDGTISIFDSGASNTLVVDYEDGNFTFDNGAEQAETVVIRDRGSIVGLRKTDDPVGSLSFSVHMREFTNSTVDNLCGVLDGERSWVSTGGTGFEPYMLDVRVTIEGTNFGDQADVTATFTRVLMKWDFSEGDPNVINVSGEVYGGITYGGISA
tara:strand:- start:9009 stop:9500 length:492 start_codon:yes stop_codon:yes gene_type:complete